ncbi:uncharacterized protein LAESUDRAFT_764591 [Laetiporus sulphureus 93-53]|uniref:Uncharacterized protein n=1 Tax=Laetiporus sulphureus 93-53 TaxID=1314785 RepID=A0A165B800_9APHY|nr:uncharacterized protein LAESUDRAFT_764591 [Laetiporus sulphureus 93-53]KZT00454.1 hypothetical protein LAESUDRAFT_764591 [Laetiporus sulphureus 93-53]
MGDGVVRLELEGSADGQQVVIDASGVGIGQEGQDEVASRAGVDHKSKGSQI